MQTWEQRYPEEVREAGAPSDLSLFGGAGGGGEGPFNLLLWALHQLL